MQELTDSDKKHLEAAEGWLELENFKEAQAELRAIGQDKASNPKVMLVVCRMLDGS